MQDFRRWGDVPTVLVAAGPFEEAALRGTVLFFHGLGASKEVNMKEYSSLAEHGFLVVGVDNAGHGERRYRDFDARFGPAVTATWRHHFVQAVRETALELPALVNALEANGLLRAGRVGACGISMGACVVYAALPMERRIAAAAALLGTPNLDPVDSPHRQLDRFFPAALLSQNAALDEVVSPLEVQEFHARLGPFYASAPERLCHMEFGGEGHMMSDTGWARLWTNVIEWFERFLPPSTREPAGR